MPSALPQNMAAYPLMMHHLDQNGRMSSEGLYLIPPARGVSGTVIHLLKQNSQAFSQITSNLSAFKDNIDLFCHTRNNITAILNDMRDMPGLMSRMPPLPVSINDDLAISILPGATQTVNPPFCYYYQLMLDLNDRKLVAPLGNRRSANVLQLTKRDPSQAKPRYLQGIVEIEAPDNENPDAYNLLTDSSGFCI
ncbi:hypothetical protein Gogos_011916 [Gossypium gossypioides]|uniref:Uncharacterized protein n=1 Tax=Gossypium gossypioides TaxID=34282 RepID=A0A7J9BQW2_GOSGO|nr:hypothetical protein [Gossypium gossypioides]